MNIFRSQDSLMKVLEKVIENLHTLQTRLNNIEYKIDTLQTRVDDIFIKETSKKILKKIKSEPKKRGRKKKLNL